MYKLLYIKKRKKLSKIIIAIVYISFLCYVIGEIPCVSNWDYTFHEILYMPMAFTFYFTPILVLVWLYYAIRGYDRRKFFSFHDVNIYVKNVLIMVSFVLIVLYFIVQSHRYTTTGVYKINRKIHENANYYVMLDDKKVQCTKNEYNLIKEGESYSITFYWNSFWSDSGQLEYIK